jgi:predicted nucleic acid-binding protein
MQIVVDASVIVAVLLNESTKESIIKITEDAEIVSPASLPWEVGNALSSSVRKQRITPEQALLAAREYLKIDVRLIDMDLEQAIQISNRYNIYAYDAYVLSCADRLRSPLLCIDKFMSVLAKGMGIELIEVV